MYPSVCSSVLSEWIFWYKCTVSQHISFNCCMNIIYNKMQINFDFHCRILFDIVQKLCTLFMVSIIHNYISVSVVIAIILSHDHRYVPFVVITILFFPHSWLITGFVTRVTRRVLHVEQELLIQSFYWTSCCSIFSFLCSVLKFIVCHFVVFFLLAILLSVLSLSLWCFLSFSHSIICP
jgi:hypothetical protein